VTLARLQNIPEENPRKKTSGKGETGDGGKKKVLRWLGLSYSGKNIVWNWSERLNRYMLQRKKARLGGDRKRNWSTKNQKSQEKPRKGGGNKRKFGPHPQAKRLIGSGKKKANEEIRWLSRGNQGTTD